MLITGDITFKGRIEGYESAKRFFSNLFKAIEIDPKKIFLCPGNHDIYTEGNDKFVPWDQFSYYLRKDNTFTYSEHDVNGSFIDNIFYLGINSSYKLNTEYGYVNIDEADSLLRSYADQLEDDKLVKIAFLHHHILNKYETDKSVVRNAFDLITLLDHYKFTYLLHGHQHLSQCVPLGQSPIKLFGVRTFTVKEDPNGYNNYQIMPGGLSEHQYIYLKDFQSGGINGGFKKL